MCYDFSKSSSMFFRIYPEFVLNGKRQFLLTCLGLHGSRPMIGSNAGSIVYMSSFIAMRVNRVPLFPERLRPLFSRFDNKNTFIQCFISEPASQTVAQY